MPDQVEVRLPELADAMASATLTAWLKEPGDPVTAGEPIAEVETDKTTVELEAPADGVLADVRVAAGAESVAVGAVLAVVRTRAPGDPGAPETAAAGAGFPEPGVSGDGGAAGERVEAPPPTAPGHSGDGGAAGDRAAARIERGFPEPGASGDGGGAAARIERGFPESGSFGNGGGVVAPPSRASVPEGETAAFAVRAEVEPPASHASTKSADVPATPLARRMAELAGLDLAAVAGSGDGGRVMKVDVELALRSSRDGVAAPAPADAPAPPTPAPSPDLPHADRPLTAMRRVTARRTAEAKRSAPHFYLEIECAADGLPAPRGEAGPGGESRAPTVNDVVVRAAALALRQVPLANSAWTGDAVRVYGRVDLAVAVATPAGLVTPVIRGADARTLAEISAELRRLAAAARAGRLRPADYQGGTCTISNLGMYGVSSLYAILNPPQSCILGVGAVRERPVVRGGAVTVGSTMTVTLSADHRAIDGATGAELLRAFKTLIEDPQRVRG